jgi:hypothetical protein
MYIYFIVCMKHIIGAWIIQSVYKRDTTSRAALGPPSILSNGTRGKAAGAWNSPLTTHHNLVPNCGGAIPQVPHGTVLN